MKKLFFFIFFAIFFAPKSNAQLSILTISSEQSNFQGDDVIIPYMFKFEIVKVDVQLSNCADSITINYRLKTENIISVSLNVKNNNKLNGRLVNQALSSMSYKRDKFTLVLNTPGTVSFGKKNYESESILNFTLAVEKARKPVIVHVELKIMPNGDLIKINSRISEGF